MARALGDSSLSRHLRRLLGQAALIRERVRFVVVGLLEPRGIYTYRLRDSGTRVWLRHPVDSWTFGDVILRRVYELPHEVRAAIPASPSVLDLGANVGLFGVFAFQELPGCTITGYEPDPGNSSVLQRTLATELRHGRYKLVQAAAGIHDGEVRFALGLGDGSHQASEGDVVPMRDAMPAMAVDLAKIDIEGGEWVLLGDARLRENGPRALVMEYHRERCPGADPGSLAKRLLTEAGYQVLAPTTGRAHESGSDQGMLWAVRSDP
jgi:FkbM family methyltransferase